MVKDRVLQVASSDFVECVCHRHRAVLYPLGKWCGILHSGLHSGYNAFLFIGVCTPSTQHAGHWHHATANQGSVMHHNRHAWCISEAPWAG